MSVATTFFDKFLLKQKKEYLFPFLNLKVRNFFFDNHSIFLIANKVEECFPVPKVVLAGIKENTLLKYYLIDFEKL